MKAKIQKIILLLIIQYGIGIKFVAGCAVGYTGALCNQCDSTNHFGTGLSDDCIPCSITCNTCQYGSMVNACYTCINANNVISVTVAGPYVLGTTTGTCIDGSCPISSYGPDANRFCIPCYSTCLTCLQGNMANQCQSCTSNLYLYMTVANFALGQCVTPQVCHNSFGYFASGGQVCVASCPDTFGSNNQFVCVSCYSDCQRCDDIANMASRCTVCKSNGLTLKYFVKASVGDISGLCYATCPGDTKPDPTSIFCVACDSTCQTCLIGASPLQCTQCANNLKFNLYPTNYLTDNHFSCVDSCPTPLMKMAYADLSRKCVPVCPDQFGPNLLQDTCNACTTPCLLCSMAINNRCVNCVPNNFLTKVGNDWTCAATCTTLNEVVPLNGIICGPCHSDCASGQCQYQSNSQYCFQCNLNDHKFLYYIQTAVLPKSGLCVTDCYNTNNYKYFMAKGGQGVSIDMCVNACPDAYAGNAATQYICLPCSGTCKTCLIPNNDQQCSACNAPLFMTSNNNYAYGECVDLSLLIFACDITNVNGVIVHQVGIPTTFNGNGYLFNICAPQCLQGYIKDQNNICQKCHPSCLDCTVANSAVSCTTCPTTQQNWLLLTYVPSTQNLIGSCASTCTSAGELPNFINTICRKCYYLCQACVYGGGPSDTCTACLNTDTYYLQLNNNSTQGACYISGLCQTGQVAIKSNTGTTNLCADVCPSGYYPNATNSNICQLCLGYSCMACRNLTSTYCLSCIQNNVPIYFNLLDNNSFKEGTCLLACPTNKTPNQNLVCQSCDLSCGNCVQSQNPNKCTSCVTALNQNNFFFQKEVINNVNIGSCETAASCGALSRFALTQNSIMTCVSACPSNYLLNSVTFMCDICDLSCATCYMAMNINQCITCADATQKIYPVINTFNFGSCQFGEMDPLLDIQLLCRLNFGINIANANQCDRCYAQCDICLNTGFDTLTVSPSSTFCYRCANSSYFDSGTYSRAEGTFRLCLTSVQCYTWNNQKKFAMPIQVMIDNNIREYSRLADGQTQTVLNISSCISACPLYHLNDLATYTCYFACDTSCKTCTTISNAQKCFQCSDGQVLKLTNNQVQEGQCILSNSCVSCNQQTTVCNGYFDTSQSQAFCRSQCLPNQIITSTKTLTQQCQNCHATCYLNMCSLPNQPTACLQCSNQRFLENNQCLYSYQCLGVALQASINLLDGTNVCLSACPVGTAVDPSVAGIPSQAKICQLCIQNGCQACSDPFTEGACLQCIDNWYLTDQGICTRCQEGMFYQVYQCVKTCGLGNFMRLADRQCVPCLVDNCGKCKEDGTCQSCIDNSFDIYLSQCIQWVFCTNNQSLQQKSNTCVASCDIDQYVLQKGNATQKVCKDCDISCLSCTGPGAGNCVSCAETYIGQAGTNYCFQVCPAFYFKAILQNDVQICSKCINGCRNCQNSSYCNICDSGYFLQTIPTKGCLQSCQLNEYLDKEANKCGLCASVCLTCRGPATADCYDCSDPTQAILPNFIRVAEQPYGACTNSELQKTNFLIQYSKSSNISSADIAMLGTQFVNSFKANNSFGNTTQLQQYTQLLDKIQTSLILFAQDYVQTQQDVLFYAKLIQNTAIACPGLMTQTVLENAGTAMEGMLQAREKATVNELYTPASLMVLGTGLATLADHQIKFEEKAKMYITRMSLLGLSAAAMLANQNINLHVPFTLQTPNVYLAVNMLIDFNLTLVNSWQAPDLFQTRIRRSLLDQNSNFNYIHRSQSSINMNVQFSTGLVNALSVNQKSLVFLFSSYSGFAGFATNASSSFVNNHSLQNGFTQLDGFNVADVARIQFVDTLYYMDYFLTENEQIGATVTFPLKAPQQKGNLTRYQCLQLDPFTLAWQTDNIKLVQCTISSCTCYVTSFPSTLTVQEEIIDLGDQQDISWGLIICGATCFAIFTYSLFARILSLAMCDGGESGSNKKQSQKLSEFLVCLSLSALATVAIPQTWKEWGSKMALFMFYNMVTQTILIIFLYLGQIQTGFDSQSNTVTVVVAIAIALAIVAIIKLLIGSFKNSFLEWDQISFIIILLLSGSAALCYLIYYKTRDITMSQASWWLYAYVITVFIDYFILDLILICLAKMGKWPNTKINLWNFIRRFGFALHQDAAKHYEDPETRTGQTAKRNSLTISQNKLAGSQSQSKLDILFKE